MVISQLLKDVHIKYKSPNVYPNIEIEHITENTGDLLNHTCFFCIRGKFFDGHHLIEQLDHNKTSLIIAEEKLDTEIPYIVVDNTRKALALISRNFNNNPTSKLNMVGVTGTDGKTTTSLIIKHLIDTFTSCAYIGTNGLYYKNKRIPTELTTPKPIHLHKYLTDLIKEQVNYVSMEVSSQGLDYYRAEGIEFNIAVFTNISHEHLDHHKTFDNYLNSKMKLFKQLKEDDVAIINFDQEEIAMKIIQNCKAKVFTYGMNKKADFYISNVSSSMYQTKYDLHTPFGNFYDINLNLFGDFNALNSVAALITCYSLGFDFKKAISALNYINSIEGRMQILDERQPFNVIVDFAHTPNSLDKLLNNISPLKRNKMTVVFGSAGDRDKTKRPIMGQVTSKYADKIILTSEDPKTEEPLDIINSIYSGIDDIGKVEIIPDRKIAIEKALSEADLDDFVVITGKGNESSQQFNGYSVEHNDIHIATTFLKRRYHK
ncbi:UDP-N-acetylmuramoyl-L-alanyl-D-glutamate--2,6-diaminopimelate ligase [Haloplasma contractile]|uniref:UDP-N-acetylmuramyl-tripeptide synthetase n=1 Tax=Haloplasma contractile SSD-17B TaxID=1033810 RepID=U2EEL9_9MOLU|nr:UDP-N-acetylmuramoyl-L-alanyl-D-glutamate--2,6-diaminopimelate ligase [Haloplasma contractile]ERJ13413.1 UDP-N-acetylmuramyl-tripeptide synthetase protein [Haloplasma contractile SSD-17B]